MNTKKNKKFSLKKLSCVLVFLFVLLSVYTVRAAELGLGVSKSIYDIEILPGGRHDDSITLVNNSKDSALPVHVMFSLWQLKESSDDIEFVQSSPELNAAKWFAVEDGPRMATNTQPTNNHESKKLTTSQVVNDDGRGKLTTSQVVNSADYLLEPKEERRIYFSITPPKDAPAGSYFVMMRFQTVPPNFGGGGLESIPEIGVLFFIKIPALSLEGGDSGYGAEIKSLDVVSKNNKTHTIANLLVPEARAGVSAEALAKAGVFDDAVEKVLANIQNTGIFYFKSSGTLEIKNWYGGTVANINLPQRYILPSRARSVEINVLPSPVAPPPSFFGGILNSIFSFLNSNSYVGPYTATLHLNMPDGKSTVVKFGFWVVPWKFWGPLLLVIGLITFVVFRFRTRFIAAVRVLFSYESTK